MNDEDLTQKTQPAEIDLDTAADIPDFFLDTLPASETVEEGLPAKSFISPIAGDDIVNQNQSETEDKEKIKQDILDKKAKKRKEKAEEQRKKREQKAIDREKKRIEREKTKRENTKRLAKRALWGVENMDGFLGLFERGFFGAILPLLLKGYYFAAVLSFAFMCVIWYGKIKLGEGPLIKGIRNTGKEEIKSVFVKIATTIKN